MTPPDTDQVDYLCSWSGGKDSALALHRARHTVGGAAGLLTMFADDGQRSSAHGLSRDVLAAQASSLGLPLLTASAGWSDYTDVFVSTLRTLKREGLSAVVFGDIDLAPHRDWCQRVCDEVGLACVHPLWGEPRESLVRKALAIGIQARFVAVRADALPPALLGRPLDEGSLAELSAAGVDLCGEQGEYHTVVVDGPGFATPLRLLTGGRQLRDGCWYVDMRLADT